MTHITRNAVRSWADAFSSCPRPAARGSSSSSSVLAEAVRAGNAPAAILVGEPDLILAIGAAVAGELYGQHIPVLSLAPGALATIPDGARVSVAEDGEVTLG